MKHRVEKGGASVELQRLGRLLFRRDASGAETQQTFFDDGAAEQAFQDALAALHADGWLDSAETRAHREQLERKHALRERFNELCARPDAAAALRELVTDVFPAGDDLERLLAHVSALDSPTTGGFRVRLDTGGAIEWSASPEEPLLVLWLYPDADALARNEHALFFSDDAAPPEPPDELGAVDWFLEELPEDRYWFTTREQPEVARCYEFDGGVHAPEAPSRTPGQVLLAALVSRLHR